MTPWEILRFAAAGLAANKVRSALTMLGILIGVGSVILLAFLRIQLPRGSKAVTCSCAH